MGGINLGQRGDFGIGPFLRLIGVIEDQVHRPPEETGRSGGKPKRARVRPPRGGRAMRTRLRRIEMAKRSRWINRRAR